ncbi:MAG: DUF4179 domain-containing protein [Dehalococcoidales bacterium]|nr:DUF4179 domain-containing protein [Dehalococcoidales bacterium]
MEIEGLEQELKGFFTAETRQAEPPLEWWNTIVAGLEDRKRTPFWKRYLPKTRLAWALALLALLVIGGTAYAATFIVRELFLSYAGHVEEAGLAQELNVSQTVGDVTVRIERAYDDGNVVLVGFTVSNPQERYNTHRSELKIEDGQTLPMMFGMGVVPGSEMIMGEWRPSERIAFMAGFDASLITEEPSSLNLRLDMKISESPLPEGSQTFTFDFSVPFNTAKTVSVSRRWRNQV